MPDSKIEELEKRIWDANHGMSILVRQNEALRAEREKDEQRIEELEKHHKEQLKLLNGCLADATEKWQECRIALSKAEATIAELRAEREKELREAINFAESHAWEGYGVKPDSEVIDDILAAFLAQKEGEMMDTITREVTARTLISILGLSEAVNDPPFTLPEVKTIIGRMAKGGWGVCAVGKCDLGNKVLYSVTFQQLEGEEEIHVTGQNNIVELFVAALKEAHRKYREGVSARAGDAGGSRDEFSGQG